MPPNPSFSRIQGITLPRTPAEIRAVALISSKFVPNVTPVAGRPPAATIDAPAIALAPGVASQRLPFLDWTRGLAVLIMIQCHVFNSFTRVELRQDGPY